MAAGPLDESRHIALMRLLLAAHQPALARRQFETLTRVLREELGEEPSAQARAVLSSPAPHPALRATLSLTGERGGKGGITLTSSPLPREGEGDASDEGAKQSGEGAILPRFFGREDELHALQTLLTDHRLVSVTGPGGAGKTWLAVETARRSVFCRRSPPL